MAKKLTKFKLLNQILLIKKYLQQVFPLVEAELRHWRQKADQCPSETLKEMALKSIEFKSFHAKGGAIYSLFPGVQTEKFTGFIVALQTISDYLDNLCDRAGVFDEIAFRQLHLAMLDALDTEQGEQRDYYRYYPYKDDGGYLFFLKDNCQKIIKELLPSYYLVEKEIKKLAALYIDLQSLKHLRDDTREGRLLQWAEDRACPELSPWEFAAATGSTLGIFMLAALAADPLLTREKVQSIYHAYFPWIGGLHILLDYFIDLEEDELEGDLNFVSYYQDLNQCQERLALFILESKKVARGLTDAGFHLIVLDGLLAMYLSDSKALLGNKKEAASYLLKVGGTKARLLHRVCLYLREKGEL